MEYKYYIDRKKKSWEEYGFIIEAENQEEADKIAAKLLDEDMDDINAIYLEEKNVHYPESEKNNGFSTRELYRKDEANNKLMIVTNEAEDILNKMFHKPLSYYTYGGTTATTDPSDKTNKIKVTLRNGKIQCDDSRVEIVDLDNEEPTDEETVVKQIDACSGEYTMPM